MSGFNRTFNFLRTTLRPHIISNVNISTKPAKHVLSTGEQAIAMITLFATILVPSGWILSHLEDYKKR
ncbi:hypothetical protein AAFF_G00283280 [Aldrovandia affinis]|uniref:Cytochrome c oxidase subunit 8B, mitochondrial n=1 Tax=Aldrovandia affinis TaxID=143900 RepID=A0AAD7X113_9TELE|nr:hypothetical protein AAFF_G00283280 [Aldrovandia affinis]